MKKKSFGRIKRKTFYRKWIEREMLFLFKLEAQQGKRK